MLRRPIFVPCSLMRRVPGGAGCETISHHERGQWARGTSRCWVFRYPIERSKHSRIGPSKVGAKTKTESGSEFCPTLPSDAQVSQAPLPPVLIHSC